MKNKQPYESIRTEKFFLVGVISGTVLMANRNYMNNADVIGLAFITILSFGSYVILRYLERNK